MDGWASEYVWSLDRTNDFYNSTNTCPYGHVQVCDGLLAEGSPYRQLLR
jgi:hypothetical protein